jgi:MFS family permease
MNRPTLTLRRVLFRRRSLDQRITSAALLVGIIVGAVVGAIFSALLAGFWIGALLGLITPGLLAVGLDRSGRLPDWALYKPRVR